MDNPEGGCNNPPFGKYVWEKSSGELGLKMMLAITLNAIQTECNFISQFKYSEKPFISFSLNVSESKLL